MTVNGQAPPAAAYAFTASDSTWTPQPEFTAYDAPLTLTSAPRWRSPATRL